MTLVRTLTGCGSARRAEREPRPASTIQSVRLLIGSGGCESSGMTVVFTSSPQCINDEVSTACYRVARNIDEV
jgi:hypothetical protein